MPDFLIDAQCGHHLHKIMTDIHVHVAKPVVICICVDVIQGSQASKQHGSDQCNVTSTQQNSGKNPTIYKDFDQFMECALACMNKWFWSRFVKCCLVDSQFVDDFFHFSYLQSATVQPRGVLGGRAPSFSIQLKGFGFSEPGIQCFSVYCVDELRVDQMALGELALDELALNRTSCSLNK